MRLRPTLVSVAALFALGVAVALTGCTSTNQGGGCMTNMDCVGNTNGSVCDTTRRICVACAGDSTCAAGQKCDATKNKCVECLASTDCTAGNLCSDGKCRQGCNSTSPCPKGTVCMITGTEGVCVGCLSNTDCATTGGRCNTGSHTCVECLVDVDCDKGKVCRQDKCTTGCSTDQTCPAGQVCDVAAGGCVQCTSSANCKDTAAPVCDVQQNKCVACTVGSDACALGTYCSGNTCVAGCKSDTDCQAGNPSPASQGKGKCLVAKHACVACLTAKDCQQGFICGSDNTCTMGCLSDQNCGAGQSCCAGQCQAINTAQNCGTCGNTCGTGEGCCNAQCTKLSTVQNCGGCGVVCASGQTCCGAGCANLLTDTKNCGSCGNVCQTGQICCAGQCRNPNVPGACVDCTKKCDSYSVQGQGFGAGTLNQLSVGMGGLTTVPASENPPPARSPYVYIAMHDSNIIDKIDANTGNVVAPIPSRGGNPSRGAQALDGSYWIAHRCPGDVNNPNCSNVAQILGDGTPGCLVSKAADGAPLPFVRALAIDKEGFVWVGTWNDRRLHKIDPNTCKTVFDMVMDKPGGGFSSYPYGLAVDSKGVLWNSNAGTGSGWMGVDTTTNPPSVKYTVAQPGGVCSYGIVIDKKDNVWFGTCGPCNGGAHRIDGATQLYSVVAGTNGRCSNGITIDIDGNLHIAQPSSPSVVTKMEGGTGKVLATFSFPTINGGYGIAGDTYGKVWLPGYSNNQIIRYDRTTGAVDFTTPLVGATPYTYSDWNGIVIRTVTSNNAQAGTWALAFDGGTASTIWSSASWNATVPKGTSVKFRFRAAASFGGLPMASLCGPFLTSPADLTTCNFGAKQWLQVNIELTTSDVTVQPSVSDFKIFYQNP